MFVSFPHFHLKIAYICRPSRLPYKDLYLLAFFVRDADRLLYDLRKGSGSRGRLLGEGQTWLLGADICFKLSSDWDGLQSNTSGRPHSTLDLTRLKTFETFFSVLLLLWLCTVLTPSSQFRLHLLNFVAFVFTLSPAKIKQIRKFKMCVNENNDILYFRNTQSLPFFHSYIS